MKRKLGLVILLGLIGLVNASAVRELPPITAKMKMHGKLGNGYAYIPLPPGENFGTLTWKQMKELADRFFGKPVRITLNGESLDESETDVSNRPPSLNVIEVEEHPINEVMNKLREDLQRAVLKINNADYLDADTKVVIFNQIQQHLEAVITDFTVDSTDAVAIKKDLKENAIDKLREFLEYVILTINNISYLDIDTKTAIFTQIGKYLEEVVVDFK